MLKFTDFILESLDIDKAKLDFRISFKKFRDMILDSFSDSSKEERLLVDNQLERIKLQYVDGYSFTINGELFVVYCLNVDNTTEYHIANISNREFGQQEPSNETYGLSVYATSLKAIIKLRERWNSSRIKIVAPDKRKLKIYKKLFIKAQELGYFKDLIQSNETDKELFYNTNNKGMGFLKEEF